jgi:imidazolonepropionase-like amidohydrolase
VHAALFDAETGVVRPDTTIVLDGARIAAVGPDDTVRVPEGAAVIDARGSTAMPGLFDMHTHPSLDDGPLYLAAGVTSIRDMAAEPDKPSPLRAFESGEALGPRVTFSGIIDGRGPFQAPTRTLVSTEAEARTAVRAMAAAGFPRIKIYSSVPPELVPIIVDEARKLGLHVSGHVPAFMTAEQAVRAGYDEIQHINMLFLNFMFDEVEDTRTPARFTALVGRAADLDLQSRRVQEFLALLKQRQVTVDPTLVTFEDLYTSRPGEIAPQFAAVADRMPVLVRRSFLEGGLPVPDGADTRYRATFRAMQRMLMALRRAGIPIVAGTDSMAGFSLPRELELYVQAGIPPAEVLRIATLDAARHLGQEKELGSIEVGKRADLILVSGNPVVDIGNVRNLRLVVKNGALLDPDALCELLGIRPATAQTGR